MQNIYLVVRVFLLVSGATLVSGCIASSSYNSARPSVTQMTVIQVNQQLEIPSQKARVYIQNSRIIRKRGLDKSSSYCSVLMQDLHRKGEPKLTVSPGQFNIIKLRRYNDDTSFPGTFFISRIRTDDFPKMVIFEVEMRLKSLQQPGVRALICAKQVMVMGPLFLTDYYPTIAEIRNTLGNTIELVTPQ